MLIDDLRVVLHEPTKSAVEELRRLEAIIAAYDALAPDWSDAPEWAGWYAIDANGQPCWWSVEPRLLYLDWGVSGSEYQRMYIREIDLTIGIDWRLCRWARP